MTKYQKCEPALQIFEASKFEFEEKLRTTHMELLEAVTDYVPSLKLLNNIDDITKIFDYVQVTTLSIHLSICCNVNNQ